MALFWSAGSPKSGETAVPQTDHPPYNKEWLTEMSAEQLNWPFDYDWMYGNHSTEIYRRLVNMVETYPEFVEDHAPGGLAAVHCQLDTYISYMEQKMDEEYHDKLSDEREGIMREHHHNLIAEAIRKIVYPRED